MNAAQPHDQPQPAAEPPVLDASLRRSLKAIVATGAGLSAVGALVFGPGVVPSVLCGALVAAVNLYAFAFIGRALLNGKGAGWALVGVLKMLALFAVAYGLFQTGLVRAVPFVIGYASLPLGSTLAQFFAPAPADDEPPTTRSPSASASAPASTSAGGEAS